MSVCTADDVVGAVLEAATAGAARPSVQAAAKVIAIILIEVLHIAVFYTRKKILIGPLRQFHELRIIHIDKQMFRFGL